MTSSEAPDPFIGRLVSGRYEVLKKLNQGGVGAVYLAMQRPLDRPVALKVLLKKYADDETAIRRFEKEAAAIARLAHAHIVTVYDFGNTEQGDLYIAMEFLRGQSLREVVQQAGFIPWERSLHIVQGITRALVAAHTQRLVHRDLKPENVMLVESNGDFDFVKVLDFGLARTIESQQPAITRHDVIPGTPVYMSPERANGISDDPRSDLYALGALWFELLVGEPPFPGETAIKVILRHVHEQPRRLAVAQPHNPVPPFIEDLVLQLLAKSVDDRPDSARALLDHINALARPTGWHVDRPREVGRRGQHDTDLQGFALQAANLGDNLRFKLEEPEPLPLTKKRVADEVAEEPLLLTKKKPSSTAIPVMASTPPQPAWPTPTAKATTSSPSLLAQPQTSQPQTPQPQTTQPSLPRAAWSPSTSMAPPPPPEQRPQTSPQLRLPTEELLRPEMPHDLGTPKAPPRIESLAQVAGWLSTAKTARAVGELCAAFLVTRFDRCLVVDMRAAVPVVLGAASASAPLLAPPVVHALQTSRGVLELASRREAYYGPAMLGPDWMPWFGALGGPAPGALFVGGLQRDGRPAFLFYADHRDITLRPMVKDTVVLLREAAAALSLIG